MSMRDGVIRAAGRSGEMIRNFEMQEEEKGRSCWITQYHAAGILVSPISIIILNGSSQMSTWGCRSSFEKSDI